MKYFVDCEFIEDGKTIDLVSIAVVAEDGREYYAQSVEFDPRKASEWVQQHVFPQLTRCPGEPETFYADIHHQQALHSGGPCRRPDCPWRSRWYLQNELKAFMNPKRGGPIELWGYYAAYDHVALCQIFGTMMDLPPGWPMWMHDLMQWQESLGGPDRAPFPPQPEGEHNALEDARWNHRAYEELCKAFTRAVVLPVEEVAARFGFDAGMREPDDATG